MPKIQLVLMCIHSGPSLNKNKQIVQICYLSSTKKNWYLSVIIYYYYNKKKVETRI